MMSKLQSLSGIQSVGKQVLRLLALVLLSGPVAVLGESLDDDAGTSEDEPGEQFTHLRTYVKIPDKERQILHEDMLDHLAVLNEINRYLAENDLRAAAEVAETGMGRSLLSKYQDKDMRPGRYMPKEMREIGWELHKAASEFAQAARQGDLNKTLQAYHHITSTCVACHYSYRIR